MSRWQERFDQHDLKGNLENYAEQLENFVLPKGSDREAIKELARLKKVVAYLNAIFSVIDADLLPPSAFDNIGYLQHSMENFGHFEENYDFSYIVQANDYIDNVLNTVYRTFVFYGKPAREDLNTIIRKYQGALDAHLDSSVRDCRDLVSSVEASITEKQESINALNVEIEAAKAEFQPTKDEIESNAREFHQKFEESLTNEGNNILESLRNIKKEAEQTFGVFQSTAQAGAHKGYADEEKEIANNYRNFALICMAASVSLLVIPELINIFIGYIDSSNFNFKWENLLIRLPVSLVIFIPALYLSKESTRHRANESYNRKQELTLRTIDSYLILMTPEKRSEIKANIAESLFGNTLPVNQKDDANASLIELFKQIREFFKG